MVSLKWSIWVKFWNSFGLKILYYITQKYNNPHNATKVHNISKKKYYLFDFLKYPKIIFDNVIIHPFSKLAFVTLGRGSTPPPNSINKKIIVFSIWENDKFVILLKFGVCLNFSISSRHHFSNKANDHS